MSFNYIISTNHINYRYSNSKMGYTRLSFLTTSTYDIYIAKANKIKGRINV